MAVTVCVNGATTSLNPGAFGLPGNVIMASATYNGVESGSIISQTVTMVVSVTNSEEGAEATSTY
jgi:hypothetical protein